MIRGMMASRLGLTVEQSRTDILANNLANVHTNGYKRSSVRVGEFEPMLLQRLADPTDQGAPVLGLLGNGVQLDEVVVDHRQGDPRQTGRPLDLAIIGSGEFAVQSVDGIRYTRDGAFQQATDGSIRTADGSAVLIRDGAGQVVPLQSAPGVLPTFEANGQVLVNDRVVGTLEMRGTTAETRVQQEYLEASNVELAKEMSDLIISLRSYQANQRAMQMQDQTLAKAVTEIGKV